MVRPTPGTNPWWNELNTDLDGIEALANEALGKSNQVQRQAVPLLGIESFAKQGPISTDFTAVTIDAVHGGGFVIGGQTYDQAWAITGGSYPIGWPVEDPEQISVIVSGIYEVVYGSQNSEIRTIRFMTDAARVAFYLGPGNLFGMMVYIDGRPTSLTPYTLDSVGHFNTITFPDAKPRLIELRTTAGLSAVYVPKPYTIWKPPPRKGPRVLIMGDSWVFSAGTTLTVDGMYQNIGPLIGTEDVWIDGIGSTGYGVSAGSPPTPTPGNRYIDRTERNIPILGWDFAIIDPDVIVVHGGGGNDKYAARSNAQVIGDATTFFTLARAKCPDAKLVFVEGFAPPAFGSYNPDYIAIRTGVQDACEDIGVYYVDVATTDPWIKGTGTTAAPTGVGNSDIYINADGAHYNAAGGKFLRGRMAPILRRILLDDGTLLNQLIQ